MGRLIVVLAVVAGCGGGSGDDQGGDGDADADGDGDACGDVAFELNTIHDGCAPGEAFDARGSVTDICRNVIAHDTFGIEMDCFEEHALPVCQSDGDSCDSCAAADDALHHLGGVCTQRTHYFEDGQVPQLVDQCFGVANSETPILCDDGTDLVVTSAEPCAEYLSACAL